MADDRIVLQLDLGQSTAKAKEFADALQTVSVVADARVVPAIKEVERATKAAERAHAEFGRGVLSVSQQTQDFVSVLSGGGGLGRAFGSITNGIPQILTQFGAGAGMAGVVGLAAVAVGILVDNFGKLAKAWDGGATEQEIERQGRLKKAIEDVKKALDAQVEAAQKQKSPDDTASGTAVKAATGGPNFDRVVENITGLDETETTQKKNDLQAQAEGLQQQARAARGKGRNVEGKRLADQAAATRSQIAGIDRQREAAQGLVVNARGGDTDAFDELLKRTTGDVHDQLASSDPRKAAGRQFNQDAAKKQIGDAIGDVINPLASGLKGRRQTERQALDQDKATDAFSAEGAREAEPILSNDRRQNERDRAKAIADMRTVGRGKNIVNDTSKQAGAIEQQLMAVNKQTQGLMEQGIAITENQQQQVAELQQHAAMLARQLQILQQGSRTIQTRMSRVRN